MFCKIGWHRWIYNIENFNLVASFGKKIARDFRTRTCKNCGNKQFYTQRPACNGVSDNEWVNAQ